MAVDQALQPARRPAGPCQTGVACVSGCTAGGGERAGQRGRASWRLRWGRRVTPPGTLWAPGPSVRAVPSGRCTGVAIGGGGTRISGGSPCESGAPGPRTKLGRRAAIPTVQPEALPSWPSAGLSPQLLTPCSLRVPRLGLSGALLLSAALLGGQTSRHPTQADSLPCFTDGFCKLLTVWTAVAPWGSPFSLPGGGQRELESPTRGLLCLDRRGYDWGAPLSSVLRGLCRGQGWTSSAPPCGAGVPAESRPCPGAGCSVCERGGLGRAPSC